ncbi:hypothetical protein [Thiosocius teredinicola]|uniref:hypothetical protein n=1 Tax=Thiosocius teredinicola TaxID=1973002 RepID=UPI0009913255
MTYLRHALKHAAGLGLCCSIAVAHADLKMTQWLYYSMYASDSAHSVHLAALQPLPNGLLASASRYPRFSGEPWTDDESALGWYNYAPRVIDCETGFSITTGAELLDADGGVVAKRDNAAELLGEWRSRYGERLHDPRWPANNELFLACTAVGDEALRTARAKLAGAPQPRLTYKPLLATLREDTERLWARSAWAYQIDLAQQDAPTSPDAVAAAVKASYDAWLASFGALSAYPTGDASQAVGNAGRQWLTESGLNIVDIKSHGDGTVEYTDRKPTQYDIPYGTLDQRPANTEQATQVHLHVWADCRSGVSVAQRLDWLDDAGSVLAEQQPGLEALTNDVNNRIATAAQSGNNLFVVPGNDSVALRVCLATAADCAQVELTDVGPFRLSSDDTRSIENAPSAQDALLVIRAAARRHRQRFVPACRIDATQ